MWSGRGPADPEGIDQRRQRQCAGRSTLAAARRLRLGTPEMSGGDSAGLLFKRRLHHASLRTLIYDAVRRVSILDGDHVEIELDDPTTREHEHLLHAPGSHASPTDHALDEPGPLPAL